MMKIIVLLLLSVTGLSTAQDIEQQALQEEQLEPMSLQIGAEVVAESDLVLDPAADSQEFDPSNSPKSQCWGYEINGRCYRFYSAPRSYIQAELFCQNQFHQGHLASVKDNALQSKLVSLVISTHGMLEPTWVGGFDYMETGKYVWTDGTTWRYTNWASSEPQYPGQDRCLEIFRTGNLWNTSPCSFQRPFICSYPMY
ncbi:snaclec coagulation factor IX/factor X-binding protein subunit B [Amia ocellicauda]|uniref:snaclec coagulation factor IX/factor X-binding protein subunit B n=1 Tax=Amia ocellicauda TaxID=2972642 RepID=UPI0034644D99